MALALLEDRLAAPTDTTAVAPEPIGTRNRAFDRVVLEVGPEDDLVVGFLAQARTLAERFPESPTALARAAQVELAIGDRDTAVALAHRVLEMAGEAPDLPAIVAAGQSLLLAGEGNLAEELLLPMNFHLGVPTMLAHLAAERRDLTTALARVASDTTVSGQEMRGWLHILLHDYRAAIRELRNVVTEAPSLSAYVNLGYAYGAQGQYKHAIRATRSATHLSPADRTAAFNLASYYTLIGAHHRARAEFERLKQYHPEEIRISFGIAELLVRDNDLQGALDELRRTRTSRVGWNANRCDRAELAGNITFLEFRLGGRDEETVMERLEGSLRETEYRSLGLARLLTLVSTKRRSAGRLERLYEELLRVHSEERLYEVAARVAILRLDFDRALQVARQWMEVDPFSENGSVLTTYLLSEVHHRHDEAAELGIELIPRFPVSGMLANNTAYALAMCGRVLEARSVLHSALSSRCADATAALINLAEGEVQRGLDGYERAVKLAEKRADSELAALIRYRRDLIVAELAGNSRSSVRVPPGFEEDPKFVVMRAAQLLPAMADATERQSADLSIPQWSGIAGPVKSIGPG